jgi:hypothetical protein
MARRNPTLDALVAVYPDHLAGYEGNDLIWKDGTRMLISDGRSKVSTWPICMDRPRVASRK